MLIKIGSAFIDPAEIAAITPDREDGLTELEQATQICITLKHGGSFWIDATMDEAEAALIDAGVIEDPAEDDAPPELTPEEKAVCQRLRKDGYCWIARDGDGKLFAYHLKPQKEGTYWNPIDDRKPARIHEDFAFVDMDDQQPTWLPWLLNEIGVLPETTD
ncbi:MAG: hypothetical protein Q4E45_02305 [Eubacteriales bacterium]|nr:hypothetical protein [Eubacteriales bacterium]